MTDTSSSRHRLAHDYAEHGDAFPGSPGDHGATAQQLRVEILAQAEVGKPVARRADKKPVRSGRKAR